MRCGVKRMASDSILPMDCKRPSFRGQLVLDKDAIHDLGDGNKIILIYDVLSTCEVEKYLEYAMMVDRKSTRVGYGHMKPRKELCYTPSGRPYVYSRVAHPTTMYPDHVLDLLIILENRLDKVVVDRPYQVGSSAVDICYDATLERGGSIAAHKDDEEDWGMVIVFSLGQTRYLRVRNDETKKFINVEMRHNSLVVMYGDTFQKMYTHQVDKLSSNEPIGTRLSLNVRYKNSS